jgi:hypothetical protein
VQAKVTHILRPGKASEKTPKGVIPPSLCEISQNASRKKKDPPKGIISSVSNLSVSNSYSSNLSVSNLSVSNLSLSNLSLSNLSAGSYSSVSKQVGAPTVPSAVIWKTCGVTNVLLWGNSSSKANK